jgi:hypothetical protein
MLWKINLTVAHNRPNNKQIILKLSNCRREI